MGEPEAAPFRAPFPEPEPEAETELAPEPIPVVVPQRFRHEPPPPVEPAAPPPSARRGAPDAAPTLIDRREPLYRESGRGGARGAPAAGTEGPSVLSASLSTGLGGISHAPRSARPRPPA